MPVDEDLSCWDTGNAPLARPGVHAGPATLRGGPGVPQRKGIPLSYCFMSLLGFFEVGQNERWLPSGVARHGDRVGLRREQPG